MKNKSTKRFGRIMALGLTCVMLAVTSGCYDSRELSDIAVVMGIAVDIVGEELEVTVQVANPVPYSGTAGEGGAKEAHSDFTERGSSIFEIIRSITHTSSRRLYHSHNQIVVLSKELAETEGVGKIIDYFLRDNEMRYSVLLAVSDGKAADVFNTGINYEHVPAKELAELIKNQGANSQSAVCTLMEFARMGAVEDAVALVPLVMVNEKEKDEESEESAEEKTVIVKGAAVFNGDKMLGTLSEEETRGALWVRNDVSLGIIGAQVDKLKADVEMFDCKTRVDVDVNDGGKATAEVSCDVYAKLAQISGDGGNIDKEAVDKIAEVCGENVEKEIMKAYQKSIELGCDIFNFGEKVKCYDFAKWNRYGGVWQEIFGEIELKFNININIEAIGDLTGGVPWVENTEEESA